MTIIIFGVLSSCFALLFEATALTLPVLSSSVFSSSLTLNAGGIFTLGTFLTLFGAALFEEISKYLFLRQYALRYLEETVIDTRSALILGALFGAGFATVELALILGGSDIYSALPLIGIAFLHILTSLFFAFYLFRHSPLRPLFAFYPILTAVFLHMLYNMAIFLLS